MFNKPWLPVANTKPGFVLVLSEYMDHKTTLRLAKEFWLYSASKSTTFGFS